MISSESSSPISGADRTHGELQPERLREARRPEEETERREGDVGRGSAGWDVHQRKRAERGLQLLGHDVRAAAEAVFRGGVIGLWLGRAFRVPERLRNGNQRRTILFAELRHGEVRRRQQKQHGRHDTEHAAEKTKACCETTCHGVSGAILPHHDASN